MDMSPTPIRRRNAAATKAKILAAAQQCFSQHGYTATGIRDVAAVAGVSYTLIGRYYGSKAGLFEAALNEFEAIDRIFETEQAQFGAHMANLIVENLHAHVSFGMTIAAAEDPEAREIAMKVLDRRLIQPLTEWLGAPDARERAVALTMLGAGFVLHAKQVPLMPTPAAGAPIARWLARGLQAIVDDADSWHDDGGSLPAASD